MLAVSIDLHIGHANLSNQGSNVDEKVEPVVDPGNRSSVINNHTLTRWQCLDLHLVELNLLSDQGRDVGFEASGTDSNHNDGYGERPQRRWRIINDCRRS